MIECLSFRVKAGWHGGDWLRIIEDAPRVAGTIHPKRPTVDPRNFAFRELLRRVDEIYYDNKKDTIAVTDLEGEKSYALFYCEGNNVNNEWFKENVLSDPEAHPYMCKVGTLMFFG